MNYKKLYEESLEKAKQGLPIDEVFPELKEGKDKRIRKKLTEIIEYFRSRGIDQQLCEECLAYLERQKEQKNYRKLYDDIAQSEWFKKSYVGKSLGGEFEQKEYVPKKNISYGELPLVSIDYMEGLDTDFEKQVGAVIASAMNREHQFTSKYIKWSAQWLMKCAKDKHNSEDECVSDNSDNKGWSEDDKTRLKVIKEELERYIMFSQYGTPLSVDDLDWLNSLPERFNLQCKPSEKQMKALNEVVNILAESKSPHESDYLFNVLNGLRNSLKKL